jgi:hypothetical protein
MIRERNLSQRSLSWMNSKSLRLTQNEHVLCHVFRVNEICLDVDVQVHGDLDL